MLETARLLGTNDWRSQSAKEASEISTGNEHFPSSPEDAVDDGSIFWQLSLDLMSRLFLKTEICIQKFINFKNSEVSLGSM